MTYRVGDVVVINTAEIIEGKGYSHMFIMKDEHIPMDEWWGFCFTVTKEDLERLQRRKRIKLKVISVEADARVIFAEAPQSPPNLRWYPGRSHCTGFESQDWGRYSWLE
jgi:hypothetical protein